MNGWARTASVGAKDSERRIINVSLGVNGADAVDMSQLKKVVDNAVGYDENTNDGKVTPDGKSSTAEQVCSR